MICQRGFRDQPSAPIHQTFEYGEFASRQINNSVAARKTARATVEAKRPDFIQHGLIRLAAAQQGAQPRLKFIRLERLDEIVVGAKIETDDPVLRFTARREQQDRHIVATPAQPAQHIQTTETGQINVQDHQVGTLFGEMDIAFLAMVQNIDRMPLIAQTVPDAAGQWFVVLDDRDAQTKFLPKA